MRKGKARIELNLQVAHCVDVMNAMIEKLNNREWNLILVIRKQQHLVPDCLRNYEI